MHLPCKILQFEGLCLVLESFAVEGVEEFRFMKKFSNEKKSVYSIYSLNFFNFSDSVLQYLG